MIAPQNICVWKLRILVLILLLRLVGFSPVSIGTSKVWWLILPVAFLINNIYLISLLFINLDRETVACDIFRPSYFAVHLQRDYMKRNWPKGCQKRSSMGFGLSPTWLGSKTNARWVDKSKSMGNFLTEYSSKRWSSDHCS